MIAGKEAHYDIRFPEWPGLQDESFAHASGHIYRYNRKYQGYHAQGCGTLFWGWFGTGSAGRRIPVGAF